MPARVGRQRDHWKRFQLATPIWDLQTDAQAMAADRTALPNARADACSARSKARCLRLIQPEHADVATRHVAAQTGALAMLEVRRMDMEIAVAAPSTQPSMHVLNGARMGRDWALQSGVSDNAGACWRAQDVLINRNGAG